MGAIFFAHNLNGQPIGPELPADANACVAQRCPDGAWSWSEGTVAMAQADLATLPEDRPGEALTRGPLRIAADCRVDNRAALRGALPGAGLSLDDPDAAYILAAYEAWGEGCAERIVGDFAFVIWDSTHRRLFAARDLSGARQLFYYSDARRLIVATERAQIFQDPTLPLAIDEEQLLAYLTPTYQWTSGWDLGWFKGVHAVPAGSALTAYEGRVELRPFWRWSVAPPDRRGAEAILAQYLALLAEAVRCRLRTRDRRVALELSGGLDSTAVVCLAARAGAGRELHSFSQLFSGRGGAAERRRVEQVVAASGVTPHYLVDGGDYQAAYPLVERRAGELRSPHELEQLAQGEGFYGAMGAAGCRVVLTGMMGDSLNEGSGDRLAYDLLRRGRLGEALRRLGPAWRDDPRTALGALLYYGLLPFAPWPLLRPALAALTLREGPYTVLPAMFTPEASSRLMALDRSLRLQSVAGTTTRSPAARLVLAELRPMLAVTASGLTGLDMRHPYTDRRLVEFALAMAPEQKWDPAGDDYATANRWHHRRALAGLVPAAVLAQGSGFDFGPALRAAYDGRQARDWLRAAPAIELAERGLVTRDGLLRDVMQPATLAYTGALLGLEAWLRALPARRSPGPRATPPAPILTAAQRARQHAPAYTPCVPPPLSTLTAHHGGHNGASQGERR